MSQDTAPDTNETNDVGDAFACPKCKESDVDKLIIDEEVEGRVTCCSCNTVYTLPPIPVGNDEGLGLLGTRDR